MAKKKDDTLYFILGAAVLGGIIYYSMNAQPAPPAAAATATTNQNNGQTPNSNTQGNNPGAVSNLLDSGVNDLQSYITDNSDQSELYDQANNDYSDNSGDGSDSMSGRKRPMSYQRALRYEM